MFRITSVNVVNSGNEEPNRKEELVFKRRSKQFLECIIIGSDYFAISSENVIVALKENS